MKLHEVLKMMSNECQGAYILDSAEILRLHRRLLEVIKDFDEICKTNNIEWSLGAGNMLGAVRHKGFIPWDDDIDVTITRKEFEKLRKCFPGKLCDKYELKIPGDEGYILHYPRIYVKNTKFRSFLSVDGGNNGLYIDIFIDENIPNNIFLRKAHGILCTLLLGIISSVRVYYCRETLRKYSKNNSLLKKEVKKRLLIGKIMSFLTMEKWMRIADYCFSLCKNDVSKDICIPSGAKHYFGEIYRREKFCTYQRVQFEDLELPIPNKPEYYLELRYGKNYMTPPKEQNREHRILIEYDIG